MWGVFRGAVICLLLTGCAVREGNLKIWDNQRPATESERAAIAAAVKNTFFDPYSIRDAEISSALEPVGLDEIKGPPMICILTNAKNRMGGYTGKSATLYYFQSDGRIIRTDDSADNSLVNATCLDNRLRYTPFTEIEQKTK